jgi:hypothetical protein
MTGEVSVFVLAAGVILGTFGCFGAMCWFSPYSGETLPGVWKFYAAAAGGVLVCVLSLVLALLGF